MTELRNNNIKSQDSFSIDAFGRWRTSNPFTVFDSKQIINEHEDLVWSNIEFGDDPSVGGTDYTFNTNLASTKISVLSNVIASRIRQTKRRFNYQPGKSQEILTTFSSITTSTGITKKVGYYDDKNGILLQNSEGTASIVRRTFTSGSAVDNVITQDNWNIDTMDGNGKSGVTLDFSKTQIFYIDLEWLGVGRVRVGFVIGGLIHYVHEFLNTNNLTSVYMSTPNLPIRYEISNDGNGEADDFECICSTVISEGGFDPTGILHTDGTKETVIVAATSGTYYPLLGIRLKSNSLGASVILEKIISIIDSNDGAYWELRFNPTVTGTFNYSDLNDSVVQTAIGTGANTVEGGTAIDAGYIASTGKADQAPAKNALGLGQLGSDADGETDQIVLCVTPIAGDTNLNVSGGLVWREII